MSANIGLLVKTVDDLEIQFREYDPKNVESVSMLNLAINTSQVTLNIAKDQDHNKEHTEILNTLLERVNRIKTEAGLEQ